MPRPNLNSLVCFAVALFWAAGPVVHGSTAPSQALTGSVGSVADAPASGLLNPHKPWITRRALKAEELAAPMNFAVGLQLRNVAELQARVNRHEIISPEEMASRY